jgi:hypothetical protein
MSQAGEVFFKVENTGDEEFNLTVSTWTNFSLL